MEIDFRKELNERQYAACSSVAHHLRIVAGAGTGKTRVLTYRIAYLITRLNVAPNRIVAITFTNKVAKEMQDRVGKLLAKAQIQAAYKPLISTFHGFCYRFLRREIQHLEGFNTQFSISDEDDQKVLWKRVFDDVHLGDDKDRKRYVTGLIGRLKSRGIFPEDTQDSMFPPYGIVSPQIVHRAYDIYQGLLKKNNAMDFDDLLMFTLRILENFPDVRTRWQNKFDAYLIDEFQDTNELQYKLVGLLLPPNGSLTVVGDPDQTIYTWRGADNDIITRFLPHDYKDLETVTLDVNYRSTQAILDKANMLIKNNSNRVDKSLVSFSGEKGSQVDYTYCFSQDNEASVVVNKALGLKSKGVKFGDMAIIYRSNYLSQPFEKALTQNRVPYAVYGGQKFFERKEVKDALAYLRLLVNTKDDFSFQRIIKAPNIGIGEKTLQSLQTQAYAHGLSLFETIRTDLGNLSLKSGVQLRLGKTLQAYEDCAEDVPTAADGTELTAVLFRYLVETGYIAYVQEVDTKEDKNSFDINDRDTRLKNVRGLLGQLQNFMDSDQFDENGAPIKPTLEDFLIDVAIQSDQDTMEAADKLMMMTAHVSKGLEFPYVFVVGLNNGTFPTNHAIQNGTAKAIEEERRLFYVAMTRAKKGLFLSSFGGYSFASGGPQVPSLFLEEIGFKPKPPQGENPFAPQRGDLYRPTKGGQAKTYYSDGTAYPAYLSGSLAEAAMKSADALLNTRSPRPSSRPATALEATTYAVGDRIAHVSFGLGVVTAVSKTTLTVSFKEPYGTKVLGKGFIKAFRKVVD